MKILHYFSYLLYYYYITLFYLLFYFILITLKLMKILFTSDNCLIIFGCKQ